MNKRLEFPNMNVPLDDLLNEDYPEISKAIKKEGYNLDFLDYDLFHEIEYENQVVGFVTLKNFPLTNNMLMIMDSYIIPKYRGNNLLFEFLSNLLTYDNFEFYPRKPTKAFINVLLKNDCAYEIASNFIVSYFKFIVDINYDVYTNPKIKKFYKKADIDLPYKANLFDMDLCNVLFRDPQVNLVKYTDFFALTEPRKYDLRKYNIRKKLKRVSEKYIDNKYEIWENNFDEIESFIQRKDDEFSNQFQLDSQVGSEDELSEDFIQELKENNLSIEDGFKIRKHLVDKLKTGQLNEKSYIQRLKYLLTNIDDIDKETVDFADNIGECPFCGEVIPDFLRSCINCGLVIREIDFEEHAIDKFKENMEDLISTLSDADFNLFEDEMIKIEDDDEEDIVELKNFYNSHLLVYDYDEFLECYHSNDKSQGIEKIMDLYLDNLLNKSLDTPQEYDTFFEYLINYHYYYADVNEYDKAFIKLIQMSILASNKSKDKNKILESNPHAIDIFYAIDDMEMLDYSFDLSKLFNEAVDTFKISKYNQNHEEVLKEFKEIFD